MTNFKHDNKFQYDELNINMLYMNGQTSWDIRQRIEEVKILHK